MTILTFFKDRAYSQDPGVIEIMHTRCGLELLSMAPLGAGLASLVCAAVTRLSMFSGPRATIISQSLCYRHWLLFLLKKSMGI